MMYTVCIEYFDEETGGKAAAELKNLVIIVFANFDTNELERKGKLA